MLSLDPLFKTSKDHERKMYEGVSLAHRDGYIFNELVKKGLFVRHSRINYQGVCTTTPQVPQVGTVCLGLFLILTIKVPISLKREELEIF